MFDVVIRNGLYFDGADGPGLKHDIGIPDGRIAYGRTVGFAAQSARRRAAAAGRTRAPQTS